MKAKWYLAIVAVATLASFAEPEITAAPEATANAPEFKNLSDLKWEQILPDLGADSPEICFLHVDPRTHATSLLIRTPKAIHVRKHWLPANSLTFITVDGAWDINWVEGPPTETDLISNRDR